MSVPIAENENQGRILQRGDKDSINLDKSSIKRPVRKWERRWVLQPNVIEYGREIWIQKWICIDSLNTINLGDNQSKSSAQYYERANGLSAITMVDIQISHTDSRDQRGVVIT